MRGVEESRSQCQKGGSGSGSGSGSESEWAVAMGPVRLQNEVQSR